MSNELTVQDVSLMIHEPKKGTTAVEIRRAMYERRAELLEGLSTVERAVFTASTDMVAVEYGSYAALVSALRSSLRWVAKDIGLRLNEDKDWDARLLRLAQIMCRYYQGFSVADVKMAFELLITGELNEYLPKDRFGNPDKDHYQNFSIDYFCKVMNAYKGFRAKVLAKANSMVPEPEQKENERQKRYYRNVLRWKVVYAFLVYKYRGYFPKLSDVERMTIYAELERVGLADGFDITVQEKERAMRKVLGNFAKMHRVGDMNRVREQGLDSSEIEYDAFAIARARAIKQVFDWMIQEEVQIRDYIKFEIDRNV